MCVSILCLPPHHYFNELFARCLLLVFLLKAPPTTRCLQQQETHQASKQQEMLMGFSVGCSELPKLLLHLLFLLGHLRRLSSWLLRLAGLDVVDDADHHHHHPRWQYSHHCHDDGAAAERLEKHSPAVRFDSLSSSGSGTGEAAPPLPDGCCVCLGDFHGAAEVRRARGCRHVFHRACLDRWAAHGHRTCPLCRTPLLPPLLLLPLPLPPS